jgi:D-arabinose 1-dehydrogenase-like Zn-dependent alcohol dehydrogenase
MRIAGEIPIKTHTVGMKLDEANHALNMLKHDELRGAAVLHVA